MGTAIHYDNQKAGIRERYADALQVLACRALAEPYNFHRIDADLHAAMLDTTAWGSIIAACQKQFRTIRQYTPHSIAGEVGMKIDDLSAYAARHAETDLAFAFEWFTRIHGQFTEARISELVPGWIMQGKTSEEIKIEADKARHEMGLNSRTCGSDGIDEFERRLYMALDGHIVDYPVKPFLKTMRALTPAYEPGDYIAIAALSGIGKTYYALNQIYYSALQGVPSCYINLEMQPSNVLKRMFQMQAGEYFAANMKASDAITARRMKAWEDVKRLPVKSLNPGPSLHGILSTIRQQWNERGIQLAVIDYAQLISVPGFGGGRNYELGEVSLQLRALALELQIPIFAMAQMKQEVSKTADKRGGMYDIKDCANFAQDATFVQCLYRPAYWNITEYTNERGVVEDYPEGYADVFNAKGRETGTALAECRFDPILGFYDVPAATPEFIQPNRSEDIPF
jgi:hypothetical protein